MSESPTRLSVLKLLLKVGKRANTSTRKHSRYCNRQKASCRVRKNGSRRYSGSMK